MAEEVSISLSLGQADKFIEDAKNATVALTGLFDVLSKFSGLSGTNNPLDSYAVSAAKLDKALKDTLKSSEEAATKIGEVGQKAQAGTSPVSSMADKVKDAGSALLSLGGKAASAAIQGLEDIGGKAAGAAVDGLKRVSRASLDLIEDLGKIALKMTAVGVGAATALGGVGVKAAGDLQQSVANISTIKPDINTDDLFKTLNQMSTRIPQTTEQLGSALYNIFSSIDIDKNGGVQLLEKLSKGAIGAQTDTETFGTAVIGVMNAYGKTVDDVDKIQDVFFNTVNAGVVNGKELAAGLGPLTSSAKAAGVSFEELGAMIVGVTKEGGEPSQNLNNLNNTLTKITTEKAQQQIQALGIKTVDATGKFRPVIDVLGDLKGKLSDMTEAERNNALQAIFPDIQARTGAQTIMNQLDAVNKALADNEKSTGSAAKAYAIMSETFNSKSLILKNTVKAALTTIGVSVLPILTDAVSKATDLIKDNLDTIGKLAQGLATKFKSGIADVLKVYGELKSGIEGKPIKLDGGEVVQTSFSRLGDSIRLIIKAFSDLGRTIDSKNPLKDLGEAAGNAKSPIDLLATGITNVATFIENNIGPISDFVAKIEDLAGKALAVYQAFNPLSQALSIFMGFMQGGLAGGVDAFEESIVNLGNAFGVNFVPAINTVNLTVKDVLLPAFSQIGTFIQSNVMPALQTLGTWIGTNLGPILTSIGQTFETTILPALTRFGGFIQTDVLPRLQDLGNWIGTNVIPILEKFAAFIADPLIPTLGKIGAFIFDTVIPAATKMGDIIGTYLAPILEKLGNFIQTAVIPALTGIANFIGNNVLPALNNVWQFVDANILPILRTLADFLGKEVAVAFDAIGTVAKLAWDGISKAISQSWAEIQIIWNALISFTDGTLKPAFTTLQQLAEIVWLAIQKAIEVAWGAIKPLFDQIGNGFQAMGQVFSDVKDTIVKIWEGLLDTIRKGAKIIGDIASGDWTKAWEDMQGTAENTEKGVGTAVDLMTTKMGEIPTKGGKAIDDLKGKLGGTDLSSDGSRIGNSLMTGMAAGINNGLGVAIAAAQRAAAQVQNAATVQLRVQSPSKEFEHIGEMVMKGFEVGISANVNLPVDAMKSFLDQMSQTVGAKNTGGAGFDGGSNLASLVQGLVTPPASANQIHQITNAQQSASIINYDQRTSNFNQTNNQITPDAAQDYYINRVMAGF